MAVKGVVPTAAGPTGAGWHGLAARVSVPPPHSPSTPRKYLRRGFAARVSIPLFFVTSFQWRTEDADAPARGATAQSAWFCDVHQPTLGPDFPPAHPLARGSGVL